MQTNQEPANHHTEQYWRELEKEPAVFLPRSKARAHEGIDDGLVERAAQALFEFVFSSCGRLQWATCDEVTKQGFRGEAKVVIETILPHLFR
jgi:hypothetical protein